MNAFLAKYGFVEDPFQSTSASDEPKLGTYFVPPPFFASVMGSPADPKSQVVLAPRGGGKTAQRVMIEKSSEQGKFLCISYDRFMLPEGFRLAHATLDYHLNQICTLLLLAILANLEGRTENMPAFSTVDKSVLKYQIDRFLMGFSAQEFRSAISSLKNWGDKASDLWTKYGGAVATLVNAFLAKYGFGAIDPSSLDFHKEKHGQRLSFHLEKLVEFARKCGYASVYVLVDRVDETRLTGQDAKQSFEFIHSLISDLQVLETPGLAFKFFLWDQMKDEYMQNGARPDRVKIHTLNWSATELERMLLERLRAHSDGNVASLNQLVHATVPLDVHKLAARLGEGSPRDMIRFCGRIIDEHTRASAEVGPIELDTIYRAVRTFSIERSEELFGQYLDQLRRIPRMTFTISQLASDVFHSSNEAVRQKVQT